MSKKMFEIVRQARKDKKLTIRQVCSATGVSVGHLSEYENGKTDLSGEKLISVCRFLGVELDSVFEKAGYATSAATGEA